LDKQIVLYKDLGLIDYKAAWDYQEELFQQNVGIKSILRNRELADSNLALVNEQELSNVNIHRY
jgi:hypothetical protein